MSERKEERKKISGNGKVLLMGDLAGYGKVALSAMIPVLSAMGTEVFSLPTALVSNTFDYGRFKVLDTTEYMRGAMDVWQSLGFSFDAVYAGFTSCREQAALMRDFCLRARSQGAVIFQDPIMADDGRYYNGMPSDAAEMIRPLTAVSDLTVPNYTEACLLTGNSYTEESISADAVTDIIGSLRALGAHSVAVTSCFVEGEHCVAGYDEPSGHYFSLSYEKLPVSFPGTGDVFASLTIGGMMQGLGVTEAVGRAMHNVSRMMAMSEGMNDRREGMPIEKILGFMDINE